MATVNLGRIKPIFKGAYSGSTAYVVDDIVTHGNETYICIQAHGAGTQAVTQTAYWTKLAAKGTDGTDVGTTITTQGDILYRDGSGLQKLAKPASNKFLQNTSGGVLSWEDSGGGVLQCKTIQTGANFSTNNTSLGTSAYEVTGLTQSITPSAASSYILITGMIHATANQSYTGRGFFTYNHSGISETVIKSSVGSYGHTMRIEQQDNSTSTAAGNTRAINLMFHPNTTNAVEMKFRVMTANSGQSVSINSNLGNSSTDADDGGYSISTITAWEIAGSISPSVTNASIST